MNSKSNYKVVLGVFLLLFVVTYLANKTSNTTVDTVLGVTSNDQFAQIKPVNPQQGATGSGSATIKPIGQATTQSPRPPGTGSGGVSIGTTEGVSVRPGTGTGLIDIIVRPISQIIDGIVKPICNCKCPTDYQVPIAPGDGTFQQVPGESIKDPNAGSTGSGSPGVSKTVPWEQSWPW